MTEGVVWTLVSLALMGGVAIWSIIQHAVVVKRLCGMRDRLAKMEADAKTKEEEHQETTKSLESQWEIERSTLLGVANSAATEMHETQDRRTKAEEATTELVESLQEELANMLTRSVSKDTLIAQHEQELDTVSRELSRVENTLRDRVGEPLLRPDSIMERVRAGDNLNITALVHREFQKQEEVHQRLLNKVRMLKDQIITLTHKNAGLHTILRGVNLKELSDRITALEENPAIDDISPEETQKMAEALMAIIPTPWEKVGVTKGGFKKWITGERRPNLDNRMKVISLFNEFCLARLQEEVAQGNSQEEEEAEDVA